MIRLNEVIKQNEEFKEREILVNPRLIAFAQVNTATVTTPIIGESSEPREVTTIALQGGTAIIVKEGIDEIFELIKELDKVKERA